MRVSDEDRVRLRRQGLALEERESDEEMSGGALQAAIDAANSWRAEHGIPPLSEREEHTEQRLHELARARGLLRPVR
jgi:hypothetical protein